MQPTGRRDRTTHESSHRPTNTKTKVTIRSAQILTRKARGRKEKRTS